jgi:prepilin-type N-terminal cleavage/methylation domain-containing protein
MRATNSPRPARRGHLGFTLIELLVVISIIGILMGLLLGGVQKVREVGKRTTVVSEVNQLDMAASQFKVDFGFNPPQYIRLPGVVPDPSWATALPGTAQKETYDGYQILLRMFPRWQIPLVGPAATATDPANMPATIGKSTGIFFRGILVGPSGTVICGSQSLVFFLGGPELQGFTASGPYDGATNTSKKGPYFDFVISRLDSKTDPDPFSYRDPYGTPYAYFSTASGSNYTFDYSWPVMTVPTAALTILPQPTTTLQPTLQMHAFMDTTGKWINGGRVQIISAGKNKRFGVGTTTKVVGGKIVADVVWAPMGPGYAMDAAPPNGDGGDDLSNFNNGAQLGAVGN